MLSHTTLHFMMLNVKSQIVLHFKGEHILTLYTLQKTF